MNRATKAKQFLDGLWHEVWFGTETYELRGMFQQGEPRICQKVWKRLRKTQEQGSGSAHGHAAQQSFQPRCRNSAPDGGPRAIE